MVLKKDVILLHSFMATLRVKLLVNDYCLGDFYVI